jgi:uncharacterized protein (UPF0335 family)
LVIEGIVEEKVSKISTIVKGFHNNIIKLELCTLPGTPLEEREKRERITQTSVEKIKSLEQEYINICDEGTQIWKDLTNNPYLEEMEEKIRTMKEQVHQANEYVNTLPPVKIMTTILANRKLYSAVEKMKEE